jgi:iron complex transport system substrate-binding protein
MKNQTTIPNDSCKALLIVLLVLAGCVLPVTAATITDDAGTTITISAPPQRIVSLSPSNTEILAALGLTDRIVGVTDVCDYPPEVKNITQIGGYSAISIEKVAAAKPDLVVASDITPHETVTRLQELGLPVIVVSPKDVDHVIRDIRLVGQITGTENPAEELATTLTRRMEAAASAPGSGSPTVAHVVWHEPLYVSCNATIQNDIISRTGGTNVFADRSGWSTVSLEEFLLANPDIIIVSGGGGMDDSERDVILEEFMTNSQYASLSAVKNNRGYAIDADIISRPGPRGADAAEQVSGIIAAVRAERAAQQTAAPGSVTPRAPGFSAAAVVLALIGLYAAGRR